MLNLSESMGGVQKIAGHGKNYADLQISQQKLCRTEIALCKVAIFWWDHVTAVQTARFLRCAWWIDWLLVN